MCCGQAHAAPECGDGEHGRSHGCPATEHGIPPFAAVAAILADETWETAENRTTLRMMARRSLTPFESELRFSEDSLEAGRPTLLDRWQRRRSRKAPTTLRGAIAQGFLRLGVAVGLASGLAGLIDLWLGRGAALGFYVVGAAVLAVAVGTSAGMGGRFGAYYLIGDRERRVNLSFAYALAGGIVIAIGVAIEAL
jgi:hypothetical protein